MSYFEESNDLKVKETVLATYGKTLESFQKDLEGLKVWLKTQPHLPQVLTDVQLTSYLVLCKCRIEEFKSKIDMYFTMRSRFLDVFKDQNPSCERMKEAQKYICFVPVPKLCSDLSRVLLIKIKPVEDLTEADAYAIFAYLLNVIDVRLIEDMCHGHTVIFDLEHAKIAHAMKITPMFLKTMFIIGEKALTTRVTAIHIVNAPSFVDQTVLLVKTVIKNKLAERIIVHKTLDTAFKSIDKNVLPKDYGGSEKSLAELEAIFSKKFEEYKDFFDQRDHWKVDEDLRPEKFKDEGVFGCYGNFKQLNFD